MESHFQTSNEKKIPIRKRNNSCTAPISFNMHKLCVCYTYVSYINHYCCISMQRDILLAVCLYSSYDNFGEPVRSSVFFFLLIITSPLTINNSQPTHVLCLSRYISQLLSLYIMYAVPQLWMFYEYFLQASVFYPMLYL